jgi:hypothetical protein
VENQWHPMTPAGSTRSATLVQFVIQITEQAGQLETH